MARVVKNVVFHVTTLSAIFSSWGTAAKLVPFAFEPLPLGSITPNGWLRTELEASAAGLGGHLHDFWPFVARSTWIGKDIEYSILNEALPYWVNALVPLAYTLDDERLKAQVHSVVGSILDRIQPDAWIGPETEESGRRMIWARTLVFLGLTNLADANSTWTQPIVTAMQNFNVLMNQMLLNNGSGMIWHEGDVLEPSAYGWFIPRTQDMIVSLQWIQEHHPMQNQSIIEDNINLIHHFGSKWEDWYREGTYIKEDFYDLPDSATDDNWDFLHGVTVAQGLKAGAVLRRSFNNDSFLQTAKNGVDWTFQYRGSASGTILADERINGLNPYYGSELCTTVETIYSLAYNYFAIGDADYADRAETTMFNALPAAVSGDWWARQYMTEPNQPYAKNLSTSPFYDVNTLGNTYSLEGNYPCCTVNHPQGAPKFTMYSFLRSGQNGIVHALLSPASLKTTVESGAVSIETQTNYPFTDTLNYTIQSDGPFDFYLRVPQWSNSTTISIGSNNNSSQSSPLTTSMDPASRLHKISIRPGTTHLTYNINTPIRMASRANDTVAIYRGQLLYALYIPPSITSGPPKYSRNQTEYPAGSTPPEVLDYTMLNTTAWNVAIDPETLVYHTGTESPDQEPELPVPTFEDGGLPMSMSVKACLIDWPLFRGAVPGNPIPMEDRRCLGEVFNATLVPYGSAKLHMSDLPVIDLGGAGNRTRLSIRREGSEVLRQRRILE